MLEGAFGSRLLLSQPDDALYFDFEPAVRFCSVGQLVGAAFVRCTELSVNRKISLMLMGGRTEGLACADLGVSRFWKCTSAEFQKDKKIPGS
jgi:hypothetical protein